MCGLAKWSVFILLGIMSVIDWKKREIPIWLLVLMSVMVTIFAFFCKDVSVGYRLAGAFLGITFFIVSRFTKEAIGYADSWLMVILGVHLGIFRVLQVLFAASLMAAIFSVFYLWKQRWKRNATLPFVPFLAVAYIGVMFG